MYKFRIRIKSSLPTSTIQDALHSYLAKRSDHILMWPIPTAIGRYDDKEPDVVSFLIGFEARYPISENDMISEYDREMNIFINELSLRGVRDIQKAFIHQNNELWCNIFIEDAVVETKNPKLEAAKLKTTTSPPHYNDIPDVEEHSCEMNEIPKIFRTN